MRLSVADQRAVDIVGDLVEVLGGDDVGPAVRDVPLPTAAPNGVVQGVREYFRNVRDRQRRDSRAELVSARREVDRQQFVEMDDLPVLTGWPERGLPALPEVDLSGGGFPLERLQAINLDEGGPEVSAGYCRTILVDNLMKLTIFSFRQAIFLFAKRRYFKHYNLGEKEKKKFWLLM